MIQIENVLVSDDVVEAKFVCDLHKCKGGCCEDGDAGAPLEKEEKRLLDEIFEAVKPYLTPEGLAAIERQGKYLYDHEFGWVTPTVNGGVCAYGYRDEKGIIKCGIEQAYYDGKVKWKKPISCHLFPIRIVEAKHATYVNYEPREDMCNPACALGKKLKMPVYQFLKEPIIRKFGEEFYEALEQVAIEYFEAKQK
ncbi:DUF3109 family protein [Flavisolibacter ginsenosidimutans]|uniref:DUF3109 family protein n=1 Tax=Flavisolibacter ginsenosidimutans TaxID=661481 RepID=A0A5B8UKQ2_9BACT|nr:DUF3109 family protein [Flavisolibacter ginsenosidimutans]QEC57143.1 DUF3109 family protein [Flavisolibacter ginsenosidimutans]